MPTHVSLPDDWATVSLACGLWHSAVVVQHKRSFRGYPKDLFAEKLEHRPLGREGDGLDDE